MSTQATPIPAGLPVDASASNASRALLAGFAGIGLTIIGVVLSGITTVAFSWLVGIMFWTAIAIGMLLFIMIQHVFDAGWGAVIRRQYEHGIAAFKWLAVLFLPLLVLALACPKLAPWPWVDGTRVVEGHAVAHDVVYHKKEAFLNLRMFTGCSVLFFAIWIWLAARLRRASFAQDADGDPQWTHMNRVTSAFGIPLAAISLTFAAIFWMKSLEYHWFSTMYGVCYFADCMRGALSCGVLIMLWLYRRGDYKGILNNNHLHSIGQLMLAFTVFWAYVNFSQYFLIWNANVPEETFWFNERESGQWWYVGMALLFCYFLFSFCYLLSYRNKIVHERIKFIARWNLAFLFLDLCFNVLPAFKDASGEPRPFLQSALLWSLTSILGIGGVCVWAYLKSFPTTKLIPIRDPRIVESLTYHEPSA
ncbi:MAG TPA: hypothetical protein VK717_06760 [Opitutaceae bacterium]|jgi:hypothetical protein|nr:hypothetical protein [Opitutaceae bacterium]